MSQSFRREIATTIQQRQINAKTIIDEILNTYQEALRTNGNTASIFRIQSSNLQPTEQLYNLSDNAIFALDFLVSTIINEKILKEIEEDKSLSNEKKAQKKLILNNVKLEIGFIRNRFSDLSPKKCSQEVTEFLNKKCSAIFKKKLEEKLDSLIKTQGATTYSIMSPVKSVVTELPVENFAENQSNSIQINQQAQESKQEVTEKANSAAGEKNKFKPTKEQLEIATLIFENLKYIDDYFNQSSLISPEVITLVRELKKLPIVRIVNILFNNEATESLNYQALKVIKEKSLHKPTNYYKCVESELLALINKDKISKKRSESEQLTLIAEDILSQLTKNMQSIEEKGFSKFYGALSKLKAELKVDIIEQLQAGKTREQITKRSDAGYIIHRTCIMTDGFLANKNKTAKQNVVKQYKKSLAPFTKHEKYGVIIAIVIGAALGALTGALLGYGVGAIPGAFAGAAIAAGIFGGGAAAGAGTALLFKFLPPQKRYQKLHQEVAEEAHAAAEEGEKCATPPSSPSLILGRNRDEAS